MASETVKFYVVDQDDEPVIGVLIRVFDETGTTFITQQYTADVAGDAVAEVTLDGDDPEIAYTIRMSKDGVAFDGALGDDNKTPQAIDIYSPATNSPTGTNDFTLKAETFSRPVATDPRLCRASGFFKNAVGQALPGLDIKFINQFKPAVVDGNAVMGERVDLRTDEDGYVEVDLYRGGEYLAWVQSIQAASADETGAISFPREVAVPDVSSANLIYLLFPAVGSVSYSPTSVSVAEDDSVDVVPTVLATDGRTLEGSGCDDVLFESADPSIAMVAVQADKLVITGVSPGTTEITATRKDQTVVEIPTPADLSSLTVTVT